MEDNIEESDGNNLVEVDSQESGDIDNSNQEDYSQSGDWNFGGSEPMPLGGIYGLFQKTLDRKDSLKVSNLTKEELGIWNLSVRDCKRVALIADTFHHPGVAKFFNNQSLIITDSAMSRTGWFTELFVTSKKYASRESSGGQDYGVASPQQYQPKKLSKWKIFSNQEPP